MTRDWTDGDPVVLRSECERCRHRWYIARDACPRCGNPAPTRSVAAATGAVVAVTSISPRLDPQGNGVSLALVDLDDGIRILARCETGLVPGTSVRWFFPDHVPPELGPHVEAVQP